jgi:hypothetical protein
VEFRARFRAMLRADLAAATDEQIDALAYATETLESLIAPVRVQRIGGGVS